MITESTNVSTTIGIRTDRAHEGDWISYHDNSESVVKTPNRMSDAMFPMRVVPMNQVGFLLKNDMTFAARFPLWPCSWS